MNESSGREESLTVAEDATGEIRIGSIPAAPAGIATVPVPGGTVYIDPGFPDAPPTMVVADPGEAAPALEQIYGEDAAGSVLAAERPASVPVVATDAAERITRLGMLRWLGSTSPFPLDRGLLMLETAVAAAACEDVLSKDDRTPPTLEDLGDVIVALAWTVREDGTDTIPTGLTDLLEDALNGLVLGLGPDDPLADTARHESELRDAMSALSIDRLDWSRWEELARRARPGAAVHMGPDEADASVRGIGSVDWTRAPMGLLDPGEGTVDWSAHPVNGGRVRIDVSVRARGETTGEFRLADWVDRSDADAAAALRRLCGDGDPAPGFRLYVPGFGLPLATGALSRSEDGVLWIGSAEVSSQAVRPGALCVDIHSAGAPGPQRNREAAAEASRWVARGLGLLRLSLAATVSAHDVRGPLERARQLYGEALAGTRGGDQGASLGLRRALARCEALLAAHMRRTDEGRRAAARLEAKLAETELPPGDREVPDVASTRWVPTVTERALLQGTGIDG